MRCVVPALAREAAALAVAVAIAAVLAPSAEAGKKRADPDRLTIELHLSPRVALRAPVTAWARIRVRDPQRLLACPEWSIDWGEDGTPSAWSSSCDPYERIEDRPTAYLEPREGPRRHHFFRPGRYEVRARVADAFGRHDAVQTLVIQAPGETEPSPEGARR